MRTLGRRIIELDPPQGFAAEAAAAPILYTAAIGFARPHLHHPHDHLGDHGRGRDQRLSAVRWGVAGNIVIAWVLTLPAAASVSALVFLMLKPFGV